MAGPEATAEELKELFSARNRRQVLCSSLCDGSFEKKVEFV